MSLKPLWVSKLPNLFLMFPPCWECTKTYLSKGGISFNTYFQAGCQPDFQAAALKVCKCTQFFRARLKIPVGHQSKRSGKCPLGDSCKIRGSRSVNKSPFWEVLLRYIEAKEMYRDGVFLLIFPGSASLTPSCVWNLKPVPEMEAPGWVNRHFSQEDWLCVSVCCRCSVLRVVACQELSFWLL